MTTEQDRSTAAKVFEVLRAKAMLERCHWNVSGLANPTDVHEGLTSSAWRAWNATRMLSTIGAFLENLADIAAEASGVRDRPTRMMSVDDDLERECTKAAGAFSTMMVPDFWHPASGPNEIWQDDSIRERWRHLCDIVCGVANVVPTYGVPTARPARRPMPTPVQPSGRGGLLGRRRDDDAIDLQTLKTIQDTW